MKIEKKKVKKKIDELIKVINYHDDLYYNKNYQEISDEKYDQLRRSLLDLERKYPGLISKGSPSIRVGSQKKNKLGTIEHKIPMLSLNNAYEIKEVEKFYERITKSISGEFKIIAETKVDGLSASLRYEDKILKLALTRGDGVKGEDITNNVNFISGVKKILPNDFPSKMEIRGEIFMPRNVFSSLNEDRKKNGEELFSTPRNAAAGSVRQLNPIITKNRKLSFFGYTILCEGNSLGNSTSEIRKKLKNYGFTLNEPSKLCCNLQEMIDFHKYILNNRDSLNYDIDGIVYKLDDLRLHKILGSTNRYPRWALAHKFPSEINYAQVKNVIFQVGRTGSITPVAILDPVTIGGVKISRATLHNEDEIKRLGIVIGDTVSIQRAGDVIPKIISVVKQKRIKDYKNISLPINCPSCGSKLYKENGEAVKRCINYYECEDQLINKLYHFVSRGAFDIEGLGEKVINNFWKKGYIKKYSDIFDLKYKIKNQIIDLTSMEGWGEKSVDNLLLSIEKSKKISFNKFIFSLGIRHIGQGISLLLSSKFKSFEELALFFENVKKQNCQKIEGIGEIIIKSLEEFFLLQRNKEEIKKIKEHIKIEYPKKSISNTYSDKTYVITGTFDDFPRNKIQEKIIFLGSKISSSISKNTDFLIVGNEPGSKFEKAKKIGIKLLYLDDLKELMKH